MRERRGGMGRLILLAAAIGLSGILGCGDGVPLAGEPANGNGSPNGTSDFDYVIYTCTGGLSAGVIPVYTPSNDPKPAKGVPFEDPNFHTTVTRISDNPTDGYSGGMMINEYSRCDPENADGSFLMLSSGAYNWYIYDALNFQMLRSLSEYQGGRLPGGEMEPRWDDADPDVFYYVDGTQFRKYDYGTDASTLIRDFSVEFPDAYMIQNDAEGVPSIDRRYWAFSARGRPPTYPNYDKFAVFTYDLEQNQILGIKNNPGGHNCVSISPYGDRVIVEHSGTLPTVSYALDFTDPVPLGFDGHSDLAIAADGRQVHVIKDDSNDVIALMDVQTGARTNIFNLPMTGSWSTEPGEHISGVCYDTPGWVLVSTYGGASLAGTWAHSLLFMLELKVNPRVWLLAHTHCPQAAGEYWEEAFATMNKRGTKVFWGSHWDNPGGQIETYQIDLPPTWHQDLQGNSVDGETR
jgi:hypothetical protein